MTLETRMMMAEHLAAKTLMESARLVLLGTSFTGRQIRARCAAPLRPGAPRIKMGEPQDRPYTDKPIYPFGAERGA